MAYLLQRTPKGLELFKFIKRKKLQYFDHIMRNKKYCMLQLILQGKIQGRRRRDRRKTASLQILAKWFNTGYHRTFPIRNFTGPGGCNVSRPLIGDGIRGRRWSSKMNDFLLIFHIIIRRFLYTRTLQLQQCRLVDFL